MSLRTDEGWLVRADGFVPKERYTSRRVRRPRGRAAVVEGVADRRARGRARGTRAITSSTRSATSRCSSCAAMTARSTPSTTRACIVAPDSQRGRVTSRRRASSARTTVGSTRSTAGRRGRRPRRVHEPPRRSAPRERCGWRRFGGFVFVNLDPDAASLARVPRPAPALLAPYHLDRMRFRSYRTTIIDANWKAVVDAFNEGYHVQGLHPQILPWTDDVSIAYEPFGRHAHYGRLPGARRDCGRARASASRPATTTKARSSGGSSPDSAARSSATNAPRSRRCATVAAGRSDAAGGVPGAADSDLLRDRGST